MTPPGDLHTRTLAIAGLGLMGGSFALALRGRCRRLLAVDPDPAVRQFALERAVVDEISDAPEPIFPQADLIVLAAPIPACLELLARLPDLHPGSAVIMDLGSTKTELARAYDRLPARFDPLPAHPMCGKEAGGLVNADPGLFAGSVFAFTPIQRTSETARRLAGEIAAAAGATPLWLDAETHDAWAARTSHVPYLVAAALVEALPDAAAALIGPGFRSAARLAGSDPEMIGGILWTNREQILSGLEEFTAGLAAFERMLRLGDPVEIEKALLAIRSKYQALLK